MSVAENGPQPSENKTAKKDGFFSPITDLASAKVAAQAGAVGGFVFAGMYVLGMLLQYGSVKSHFREEAIYFVLINVALVALIVFLAWRVKTRHSVISALLLLLWFTAESLVKVMGGAVHLGWVFFYLIVAATLLRGVLGCWKVRKYRHTEVADTFN
jgi:hypothetical protein